MHVLVLDPQTLQLIVVLGPILVTVILGPLLISLVNRVKSKAEAESFEVLSDKARFEAMDLLVKHLREEIVNLRADLATERATVKEQRSEAATQATARLADERAWSDVLRWAQLMRQQIIDSGKVPPRLPGRISWIEPDEGPKALP